MKIMVVDDDSMVTDLLESLLSDWGYEPVTLNRGPDALVELARDDAPQLVILDWNMPLIDGLTVAQSVRKKEGPYTYIIILTGNGDRHHVLKALSSGVNDFVVKPFNPDDLKARIEAGVKFIQVKSAA